MSLAHPGKAARALAYYRANGKHEQAERLAAELAAAGRCRILWPGLERPDVGRAGHRAGVPGQGKPYVCIRFARPLRRAGSPGRRGPGPGAAAGH